MRTNNGSTQKNKSFVWKLVVFGVLLILLMFVSLLWGRYNMGSGELWQLFQSELFGTSYSGTEFAEHVVFQVRLPRILIAALVGAGLAIA